MDRLLEYLRDVTLDQETLILAIIFISTTLIITSVTLFISGLRSPIKRQLNDIKRQMNDRNDRHDGKLHRLGGTLESITPFFSPKSAKERASVASQLMHAGFHDAHALTHFYSIKAMTVALGIIADVAIYFLYSDAQNAYLMMIILFAAGMYSPNIVLHHLVKKRQLKIRNGIADSLDLLVVCTESGLGFNAALKRVAEELYISHPEFADELDTVCGKVNAGVELQTAFEDLVRRTGVEEITGLVKMLAHASKIGGSLSQTLREYTEDYRDKRTQAIEEIAAKIPTKMIFPLLLFIWPCFFIVAVGPSILTILDMLNS